MILKNLQIRFSNKMPNMEEVEEEMRERARAEISNTWWVDGKVKNARSKDVSEMKTYLVRYWRNDGGWHTNYDYLPTYVFLAEDDTAAKQLALIYTSLHKSDDEEFRIHNLAEVDFSKREVKIKRRDTSICTGTKRKQLEKMINNAHFDRFEDAIFK